MAKICIQALLGYDGVSCDPNKGFEMTPMYNSTRFQYGNSNCGLYSLYMIISMLQTNGTCQTFNEICKNTVDDDTVNTLRKRLYIDGGKVARMSDTSKF